MVSSNDIAAQKHQADEAKRQADALAVQQKELLRKGIANIDHQIADLRGHRSKAASDLGKL